MKKFLCIILSVIIVIGSFAFAASAKSENENIFVSSDIKTVILIPYVSRDTERYAAKVLQKYIAEITGKNLEISTTFSEDFDKAIFVGDPLRKSVPVNTMPDGSYVIDAQKDILYISGSGNRGTIYGVYGFLQKYCDCRWYTKDLKVIPKSETISVPNKEYFIYKPCFESTETDWSSPRYAEYSLANGLCGGVYRSLSAEQGGTVNYISDFCHTLTSQFCSADKYFESHPEYFALRNGKRDRSQLCLSNPDVVKIVTDEVLELLKNKHDPTQALQIVSLTQADNQNYCTCDKCKAIDNANYSQSGSMVTFVNKVAKVVKENGYDNVAIDTFAYQYTRHAPTQVKPDDNVIIRLCSIECCFGHTIDDKDCKENVNFMKDLTDWGKICNRIYIWDYATNYGYTVNIFPDFGVLQRNMQVFYENNAKGMYVEGAYYMARCDAEFGELRAYLISKLMQNPYMDYDAEMNGFLKAYYGEGWQNIREFIDITTKRSATKQIKLTIGQEPEKSLPGITLKEIKKCDKLWENAKALANDETTLNNIKRSELCWRFWKCANEKQEFSRLRPMHMWMSAQKHLYDDYVSFGVSSFGEDSNSRMLSDCESLYLLRRSTKWTVLYNEKYWDVLAPFVVKFYTFITNMFGVSVK